MKLTGAGSPAGRRVGLGAAHEHVALAIGKACWIILGEGYLDEIRPSHVLTVAHPIPTLPPQDRRNPLPALG